MERYFEARFEKGDCAKPDKQTYSKSAVEKLEKVMKYVQS